MNIYEKLLAVQQDTKCQKGQFNSFGNYKYRNLEDVWAAVKPVAASYGAVLTCTDTIVQIGDRFYVEATATIYDIESGENISVKASAREDLSRKGMDGAQITGTSSSYARKYAMGGLLGLDDTKDADTDQWKRETDALAQKAEAEEATTGDRKIAIKSCVALAEKIAEKRVTTDGYNGRPWDELTDAEIAKVKVWLVAASKKA